MLTKCFPYRAATTLVLIALSYQSHLRAAPAPAADAGTRLHNGWKITPAGRHEVAGDMLLGCALSPDGKTLALTSVGYGKHQLHLVDTTTGKIRQSLPLGRAWNGVAWNGNDTIYVSGGASPAIHVFLRRLNGSFSPGLDVTLPDIAADPKVDKGKGQAYLAGLALAPDRTLYIANLATDTIYARNMTDGTIKVQRQLDKGVRPFCVRLAPDGLYVTQWAESNIVVLNPATLETVRTLATGSHPNDFVFAPDGRLFVSCANDDAVVVLDRKSGAMQERILTHLTPQSPAGATPNAIALSPDGKTLYVANADNNAVAVVDVSLPGRSHVRGFIPTGWYPTAVCVAPDGQRLFIGSGKGLGTHPNPAKVPQPNQVAPTGFEYIGRMLHGVVSTVPIPDEARLAAYTKQVYDNTPYNDALIERPARAPQQGANAIPSRVGDASPLKYILYIIKENRTYDQVMGDFKDRDGKSRGNGDPNLTLFGEDVTPNQHELARQYVLLDNTYCNGEVSADGHPWSTAAYVTDIVQRLWPPNYGGKGPAPLNEKVATPPAGYI
ncbi:MAG: SMP-30/gluconolactonase/LRE family protein [Armatimonadota bacterium]|nr:SMP-30/gluconolactonase/LRE family protein [Armatimonadota bacterium]